MSNEYDYSGLYNNGQGGSTPDPNQGQNNNQPRNEANQASATFFRPVVVCNAVRQHRPHRLLGRQQHQ